jgi:hypothetical protein
VDARHEEDLTIASNEWFQARPSLTKKTLVTRDPAKLLRPGVASDSSRQSSQTSAVPACQEYGPEVTRWRQRNL